MAEPRDLVKVIDAMLLHVPETEEALRGELLKARSSCGFTAPEQMHLRWKRVAEACETLIGQPTLDWRWAVIDVLNPGARKKENG